MSLALKVVDWIQRFTCIIGHTPLEEKVSLCSVCLCQTKIDRIYKPRHSQSQLWRHGVALAFDSDNEILWCDHSNETVPFVFQYFIHHEIWDFS